MSLQKFLIALFLFVWTTSAFAQTEPSTRLAPPDGPIKVKITTVQGIVQFRTSADQKWAKAVEGTELTEGAELRTGPRSAVQFMIGDDQTVTLDRLGTIQILKANFTSGKVFTDLGMKYGRTRYDIESAAREHDAKVRSPSSVLAVRGTQFSLLDQPPFAAQAVSLRGRVMFKDAKKLVAFGGKTQGKTKIDTESASAADKAKRATNTNPGGLFTGETISDQERSLEASYGSNIQNLGVISLIEKTRLQGGAAIANFSAQEELRITATWRGAAGSDVDLSVLSPEGLLDATHRVVPSPGVFEGNQVANDFGLGSETAEWTLRFPEGKYTITTALKTPGSVNVFLDVLRDPSNAAHDSANLVGTNNKSLQYPLDSKNPSKTITVNATGKVHAPAASSAKHIK